MRLIDADILKSAIEVDGYEHFSGCLSSSEVSLLEMVKDDIDETPTVDAVPVVRCLECKHFRHYGKTSLFINGKNIKAGWCQRRISYDEEYRMTADDFCSYGKRKEGADNG